MNSVEKSIRVEDQSKKKATAAACEKAKDDGKAKGDGKVAQDKRILVVVIEYNSEIEKPLSN